MAKEKDRRNPVAVFCSTLGTVVLVSLVIFCIPLTIPRLAGYKIYSVISGSMEPEIPIGSLVYIKSAELKSIMEKDVIAFYGGRDSNAIITHRVVNNNVVTGEIITKGDANQTVDRNPVSYSDVIGKVEYVIPKIGQLAQVFTGRAGKLAGGGIIAGSVVLHFIGMHFVQKMRSSRRGNYCFTVRSRAKIALTRNLFSMYALWKKILP